MEFSTATIVGQLRRTLEGMDGWIDKVHAHATAKRYDADLLLQVRLAPDMFPLVRQYGSACDSAKLCAARLSGRPVPSHADDQKTWADVRHRVRDVVTILGGFGDADFANAAATKVVFPWNPGKGIQGREYLLQYVIPNFHFHASMAYAILRHNGVELGKADFLGPLPFHDV
ncbi:MAG: DUF1993 domain-containing protein [Myxococcota bacterium]